MYNNGHSIDDIWRASGFSRRSSRFRILNNYEVTLNRDKSADHLGNVKQNENNKINNLNIRTRLYVIQLYSKPLVSFSK